MCPLPFFKPPWSNVSIATATSSGTHGAKRSETSGLSTDGQRISLVSLGVSTCLTSFGVLLVPGCFGISVTSESKERSFSSSLSSNKKLSPFRFRSSTTTLQHDDERK